MAAYWRARIAQRIGGDDVWVDVDDFRSHCVVLVYSSPYFIVENLYTVTSCSGVDGVTTVDGNSGRFGESG